MINKYGIVLISYPYNDKRREWADWSFKGLAKTNVTGLEPVILQLVYKPTIFDYELHLERWKERFMVFDQEEPEEVKGLDPVFIWTADKVARDWPDRTHLIFMTDDVVYNPEWLQQLDGLIERHPVAKGYTVYRSAYEDHHKTLYIDPITGDIQVRSISGVGAMSREEWLGYAPDWKRGMGGFPVPWEHGGGDTFDLHHAWERPGERWSTPRSYWQHVGMVGTHGNCNLEVANDFVGE